MTDVLTANLVHFVRHLRTEGMSLAPSTATDLAAVVDVIGLANRDELRVAFRALTVVRPAERPIFDDAFDLFFGEGMLVPDFAAGDDEHAARRTSRAEMRAVVPVLQPERPPEDQSAGEVSEVAAGSYIERLTRRDFKDLTVTEREDVRRLLARMIWRPADARSRRWGPKRTGRRPDMRRTFRHAVRVEGDLMPLAMASRKPRRRPLVVIADISGSMERYTEMFLYFIHAAQGRLGRVEAFVFATRLTRITREMRQKLPDVAIRQVSDSVEDWSGGTRIGEAIEEFNREWSRRVGRGGAIGLIISDGWDTGDPELLRTEMARLHRSTHRLVWLNPLASREGFSPETRGLRAALPHVDHFLAAGTLRDLRDVIRLLESVPAR